MQVDSVYPGHAVTIALFIVTKYDTLGAAEEPGTNGFLRALEDVDIPGSGDCVHSALDFLRGVRDGQSFDAACSEADAAWAREKDGAARQKGQQMADVLKPVLRSALKEKWGWQVCPAG